MGEGAMVGTIANHLKEVSCRDTYEITYTIEMQHWANYQGKSNGNGKDLRMSTGIALNCLELPNSAISDSRRLPATS